MTRRFWQLNLAIQLLLGVSTGAVKLAGAPFEWALFETAGFSLPVYLLFGTAQILAALGLLHRTTRQPAAFLAAVIFVAASGVLAVNGQWTFGVVSLLFPASVLLVGFGPDGGAPTTQVAEA